MRLFVQLLLWLESTVAVLAYLLTATLLLSQVLAREIFTTSIDGGAKVAVLSAIIAGSLGMVIATGENAHLRPTFADGVLPYKWTPRVGDILSAILHIFLGYFAIKFVVQSHEFKDMAELIRVPLWPFQLVFPYMFFSSAFKHLIFAWQPEWKPRPILRD
ncbi:TRAP transporter small permease [Palleronia caenipelagi]|uniref:TRAP transporter small permease protein n=1 Tax=Palleronia caenipelagi TaxID=2489174 RepID=A0A547PJZ9_9RHOB|nr:TRAP transporter small permease subunit [Palleronia caenipelagi]TRD14478.1 TRAP transporter small permease [Palleronia caenipelagi]